MNLGALASHEGTALQSLLDAFAGGRIPGRERPPAIDAPASCKSSIFLRRMVGVMFMQVNSKCAHQVRPPTAR